MSDASMHGLIPDGEFRWRIPMSGDMRVDGLVFASKALIVKASEDRAVDQVANVAHLPGIVGQSIAMPDIHWGYGFPIGGVAATDVDKEGVVSPGGVGFDIGCGVRLLSTGLSIERVRPLVRELAQTLYRQVPHGVGGKGLVALDSHSLKGVMTDGALWAVANGIGPEDDAVQTEDSGKLEGAEPSLVSDRALKRGAGQLGSLGAGNHFLEMQVVDQVFDDKAAEVMGLALGDVCVMIHSGSRGLGHQICTEEVRKVDTAMKSLGIEVPDRQLACAPVSHDAGQNYMAAMAAAANFARANRHVMADAVRRAFESVISPCNVRTIYDVSHNLAKVERHSVGGTERNLCVHRKGATRSFGPGHPDLPERYLAIGQPVIVPGSMGTASWLAVGTDTSDQLSFGSTCHGAGRLMSRKAASKAISGQQLKRDLEREGVLVQASQVKLLAEEAPFAYKDVDEVIEVCDRVGLSKKVAKLKPLAVVKG